jgi:uncharacterized protein with GYD domain
LLWAVLVLAGILFLALWHFLARVPKTYPPARHPMAPAWLSTPRTNFPAGFDSPYLGHTGSADGKGGGIFGSSKAKDLAAEARMGLHWTFAPVSWRALEPEGPVDLHRGLPAAWKELDGFVIEAHRRALNILLQAPVIGGNAGGPPPWAGRREKGKSAPLNLEAAAVFAGKLAARYAPHGTLPTDQGWQDSFGVRAWELDNEPDSYLTHWDGQAAAYAEFVTKVSDALKRADPLALILAPATPVSRHSLQWLNAALGGNHGGSMASAIDVVSFHIYEGLDTALSGEDRDIDLAFDEIRSLFEQAGFSKREYWHTEGNFDFLGILSAPRRAAWRMQFMTRAFAAGVAKVCVMDASPIEQNAVRAYIDALPNPFPMFRMSNQVDVISGRASVFWHPDPAQPNQAGVWILWAEAGTGDACVSIPAEHSEAILCQVDGSKTTLHAANGRVTIFLRGDAKMAPPLLVLDRSP